MLTNVNSVYAYIKGRGRRGGGGKEKEGEGRVKKGGGEDHHHHHHQSLFNHGINIRQNTAVLKYK